MLETSLEGFSWCWRVETNSEDFHGAGDFFGGIFTVLETSLDWRDFHGAGDFFWIF